MKTTNLKKNAQCDRPKEPYGTVQFLSKHRRRVLSLLCPRHPGARPVWRFRNQLFPGHNQWRQTTQERVRRRDDEHGFLLRIPSPQIGVPRRWKRATGNRPPFRFPEFSATSERQKRGKLGLRQKCRCSSKITPEPQKRENGSKPHSALVARPLRDSDLGHGARARLSVTILPEGSIQKQPLGHEK
ncbi:unnamed protein product [Bursaphelenchus xylophilus]|uniref:(pine wood nematode) hypothetical protein n=1 Tax=Bursaphelenchus xylophilus TaxID=6326 RepID=A0A1I7RZ44_BURXY|nr:unnamed protein product [Bursaphelenchus xylophilus]CAG9106871.1 unnamed protein product [Bursaphelenchus xylophilus]